MAEYEYIGDGRPDGTIIGRASTEKLGFYGTAPIVKPTCTFAATSGSTVAASVAADLYALRLTLESLGILTTA